MSRALVRGLAAAAALALSINGAVTLSQGLAVPVKAQVSQDRLERDFERSLALVSPLKPAVATVIDRAPPARIVHRLAPAKPTPGAPVARLEVERLGVKEIVLSGEPTNERLARGPIMVRQADARSPVTVLAAHRDTHFEFVQDLRKGDAVSLQMASGTVEHYRVVRFETVRWDRFAYPLDPARPLLALATCYPFGGTEYGSPWRRVAWAERI